jgi:predicted DNA-binding protein (MmcQ/YjbR family)
MMKNDLDRAVRALCLAFPGAEEDIAHGMPQYRVQGGKVFATYAVNHHGDGRIALWLCTPAGMQDLYARAEPTYFFKPPYVGPRGWLGVRLDAGLPWKRVASTVRAAYENVAPARLIRQLEDTPQIAAPKQKITVADVDPANTPRGQRVLASMRKICLALPETVEDSQFGRPVWRAGSKVFARAYCSGERWRASFWVGVEAQGIYTVDPRYTIPAYVGHSGWIELDVAKSHRESELRSLALQSYRHFALARMLARLPQS